MDFSSEKGRFSGVLEKILWEGNRGWGLVCNWLLDDLRLIPRLQPHCSSLPPSKMNEVGIDCCKALGAICWKGNPGLPFSSGWVVPGAVNPGSSEWPGRTTSFLWWRRSWQAEMLSLQTTFERHIKMPNKTCWLLNPLSNYSFQIGAAALKRSWGNF